MERSFGAGSAGNLIVQEVVDVLSTGGAVGGTIVAGVVGAVVIGSRVTDWDRVARGHCEVLEGTCGTAGAVNHSVDEGAGSAVGRANIASVVSGVVIVCGSAISRDSIAGGGGGIKPGTLDTGAAANKTTFGDGTD